MFISSRQFADVILIKVEGRIADNKTAKDFENALNPFLNACFTGEYQKILLDFEGLDLITSAGLRVLMIVAKTCEKQETEIVVAALQPIIENIFKISRFDSLITIFPTVKSALESMSHTAADLYISI